MKQLVCANMDCDRKSKIFNIEGMTEPQIQEIESRHPKPDWLVFRRET